MALTEEMKRQISEDAGVKDAFKKGDIKAAKILADLGLVGLSFLPVGAAIRGGTLVYKGLRGAKAAKELRKLKSVQDAIKAQRPAPGKPTTITAPKPKVRVPAGKPKPAAKQAPKAADKPKPKPTPPRAPGLAKNRQRVDGKPIATKPAPKPAPKPKPKPKPAAKKSKTTKADRALAAATTAALVGTAVEKARRGGKADADTKRKPSGPATRGSRKPPSKKAAPKATPKGMGDRKSAPKKVTPTKKAAPKGMADRKSVQRKAITAGKNVGFGPKGNIFPKNAEDRARLMRLYGGTGSAAAKAAAAGKQGTLKKGKK